LPDDYFKQVFYYGLFSLIGIFQDFLETRKGILSNYMILSYRHSKADILFQVCYEKLECRTADTVSLANNNG